MERLTVLVHGAPPIILIITPGIFTSAPSFAPLPFASFQTPPTTLKVPGGGGGGSGGEVGAGVGVEIGVGVAVGPGVEVGPGVGVETGSGVGKLLISPKQVISSTL